ncbi:hypothetical protein TNCV_4204671 [Trichonephila clavipes]|nr:hypothetical protein TNCV_4204671 [Trichonephila clavipes]
MDTIRTTVGIKMRNNEDILIKDLLLEERAKRITRTTREFLRKRCKKNIEKPCSLKIERRITEEEKLRYTRRYEVEKVGQHDGPNSTTTSADLMKHFYA